MATWYAPLVIGFIGISGLLGCQQTPSAISGLPGPSFDAPRLATVQPVAPVVAALPPISPSIPQPARTPAQPPHVTVAAGPRDWTPPVPPRAWRWIIIHHSATTTGGAAAFDKMHRAKGWDELGYDFVIGNGTDTADGQIEVGPRWTKQKIGAHAKTPDNRFNEYGVGICMVGNFDVEKPTPRQMQSLTKLVAYLMKTYHITPDRVLGHGETKSTDCPGKNTNLALIRRQAAMLAGSGAIAHRTEAANHEMLTSVPR